MENYKVEALFEKLLKDYKKEANCCTNYAHNLEYISEEDVKSDNEKTDQRLAMYRAELFALMKD